jgi:hypothetical protein
MVIPISDTRLCLVWTQYDLPAGHYRLVSQIWNQGVWTPPVFLENGNQDALYPTAGYSSGYLYVAWIQSLGSQVGAVIFTRSVDGGLSWDLPKIISTANPKTSSVELAVNGAILHLVWSDARTGAASIYYAVSPNGGTTWSQARSLVNTPLDSRDPQVTVSGSQVHVVWEDWRNNTPEIYYRHSVDSGTTWAPEFPLSVIDTYASEHPDLASVGPIVQLVWQEETLDGSVVIQSRSTNDGNSWMRKWLTLPAEKASHPVVGGNGNRVLVGYQVELQGSPEIKVLQSVDSGATWLPSVATTVPDANWSGLLAPGLSTNAAYLVWTEILPPSPAVFISRNPPLPALPATMWMVE